MSDGKGRGDPAGIADIRFNQHSNTLISTVGTAALADLNENPIFSPAYQEQD